MAMNMLDCLSTKIYLILSCDTTLIREYFCKRCKQIICHGFRWGNFFSSGDGVIQSHRWNDLRRIWCKYVRLPLNHEDIKTRNPCIHRFVTVFLPYRGWSVVIMHGVIGSGDINNALHHIMRRLSVPCWFTVWPLTFTVCIHWALILNALSNLQCISLSPSLSLQRSG